MSILATEAREAGEGGVHGDRDGARLWGISSPEDWAATPDRFAPVLAAVR